MAKTPEQIAAHLWNDRIKREFAIFNMYSAIPEISSKWTTSYIYSQLCWQISTLIGLLQEDAEDTGIPLSVLLAAIGDHAAKEHDENLTKNNSGPSVEEVLKDMERAFSQG
jgi:hypothetical protein